MNGTLLLTGGCRSGKSDAALRWAESVAPRRAFVATCAAEDPEMRRRVDRHRRQRGDGWRTLEYPLDALAGLERAGTEAEVAVLDCVTLWLSNMLARGMAAETVLKRVEALACWLRRPPLPVAVVTNELGWGIVPATPLGRAFRDLAGEANQILALACRDVVLLACGLPLALKGATPEVLI